MDPEVDAASHPVALTLTLTPSLVEVPELCSRDGWQHFY